MHAAFTSQNRQAGRFFLSRFVWMFQGNNFVQSYFGVFSYLVRQSVSSASGKNFIRKTYYLLSICTVRILFHLLQAHRWTYIVYINLSAYPSPASEASTGISKLQTSKLVTKCINYTISLFSRIQLCITRKCCDRK